VDSDPAHQANNELFAGPFGALYTLYMERPWLARIVARMAWRADIRPFYAGIGEIGERPAGAVILDAPCGAGVAFRGLRPEQDVRYIALDVSPDMLGRARKAAERRKLRQIEFVEGDATATGVPDGSVDLFLSYWGLHCFADPAAGVAEAARTLRPGGRLTGACFVDGKSLRQDILRRQSPAGALPRHEDLEEWLAEGFEGGEVRRSGPFAYFSATRL
jgi:ubiquinone/menaquinone biosynthesis C-methylase UbiE